MAQAFSSEKSAAVSVGFVLALSVFAIFFNLGGRTLENQDYLRYPIVAMEILETGDWVVPHLGGHIYVAKPPLHMWNIAFSYRLFGIGAWAARFPSALFGLVGIGLTLVFGMGVEKQNHKIGIYAALLLLASYGYAYFSRIARIDIELTFFFSLSLFSFYGGYETLRRKRRIFLYALFWFSMGCAFLDKGPIAFVAALIALVFLVVRREWRRCGVGLLGATFPAFLISVLPWVIMLIAHDDFSQYLTLLRESRFITRSAGPFYYLPEFFMKFFPGSIILLVSLPALWKSKRLFKENPRMSFALVWALTYLLILHLSQAKNHRYLLPAFPPLAVIAAWGAEAVSQHSVTWGRWRRHLKGPALVVLGLIGLGMPLGLWLYRGWYWGPLGLGLAAAGASYFAWKVLKDDVVLVCALCILSLLALDLGRTAVNPNVSRLQTLYLALKERDIGPEEVVFFKTDMRLRRTLSFYYGRLLPKEVDENLRVDKRIRAIVTTPAFADEVRAACLQPPGTWVLGPSREQGDQDIVVIFPVHGSQNRL